MGPNVQTQCLSRLLRPATGVTGTLSLSSSSLHKLRLLLVRSKRGFLGFVSAVTAPSCPLSSFSVTGETSGVEFVEDWISECLMIYSVVIISSVRGAEKATFLAAGNIGRDCAKDSLWLCVRAIGPFVRMDEALKGNL